MTNPISNLWSRIKKSRHDRKIRAAGMVLMALDTHFYKAGYNRSARRRFWRGIVSNKNIRTEFLANMKKRRS